MPEVVVVGAGPVGLLLGHELGRRGVETEILERRSEPGGGSRAIGVHAPVLAALEASGITERLLAGAVRVRRGEARSGSQLLGHVRFDRLRTRFPFVATLPQSATEAALAGDDPAGYRGADAVRGRRGADPAGRRGADPAGRSDTDAAGRSDADAVRVRRDAVVLRVERDGERMRVLSRGPDGDRETVARIVVVASGSAGRELAYRPGAVRAHAYADRYLMADIAVADDDPTAIVRLGRGGVLESFPLPGSRRRYVAWDTYPHDDRPEARLARLQLALRAAGEGDAAARLGSASGFGVRRVVAPRMRRGALFVVGDAAHEVSPIGGQGMNLGLLDAAFLAPLLAGWVRTGVAPEAALARWERRRVASARTAAALATMNTVLGRPAGVRADAVRRAALRILLAPPTGMLFAHAYAMGLDRDA